MKTRSETNASDPRTTQMMHPTFKSVSRRRFLRGLGGVAVGLPFLEALAPRSAQAQTAAAIQRFGVFMGCNGVDMGRWFPNGAYGALTDQHLVGTANEALIPFRSKLLFPRGVHMAPRAGGRDPGGGDDHGRCMAHKLTAFPAATETGLAQGPSIDYVLSQAINPGPAGARRQPLNLWVGRPGNTAGYDYISYRAAGQAIQAVNNPWDAYATLMSLNTVTGDSDEARARILQKRQSVLDLVQTQFDRLKRLPLSTNDRQKLDMHFTAVREVEVTVSATGLACLDPDIQTRATPYQGNLGLAVDEAQYPTVADVQVDIFALALACDMTRVATLHFDRGSGGPTFKWDGMNHEYNHHKLSHGKVRDDCFGDSEANGCSNVAGFIDMIHDIDRWHQRKFARLLEKLNSYVEADGRTVLDNSAILYTNEMSDGKLHSFMDLPLIIAGSAGGRFRQNLYFPLGPEGQVDTSAPHNRLLNTIVNVMGIQSDWFGLPEGMGGATMQGGIYEQLLV
ncbi:MAG TPA: DUF1552 domain-containing protein [Polyangiaceae bacterium]|nr:DUF1552 domain-containing protein [Polyangiaceae bacterium]